MPSEAQSPFIRPTIFRNQDTIGLGIDKWVFTTPLSHIYPALLLATLFLLLHAVFLFIYIAEYVKGVCFCLHVEGVLVYMGMYAFRKCLKRFAYLC